MQKNETLDVVRTGGDLFKLSVRRILAESAGKFLVAAQSGFTTPVRKVDGGGLMLDIMLTGPLVCPSRNYADAVAIYWNGKVEAKRTGIKVAVVTVKEFAATFLAQIERTEAFMEEAEMDG